MPDKKVKFISLSQKACREIDSDGLGKRCFPPEVSHKLRLFRRLDTEGQLKGQPALEVTSE